MKLATAAEMAAVDRSAAAEFGVPVTELMENAGRRSAAAARMLLGPAPGRRIAIFCGCGNNGGDGLVAARVLLEGGAIPRVVLVGRPGDLRADARRAFEGARAAGVEITACPDLPALEAAAASERGADLVIDAILGTGFVPPARELAAAAIRAVNSLGAPVLAVDIPSGLSADHGRVTGDAVRAAATVTFGFPKPGLVLHPGAQHVGRLWLADIGFPEGTAAHVAGDLNLSTAADMAPHLAPRDPESHKGSFGHVVLVAGSRGLAGAAALAARGALRAGAGLVTAALPDAIAPPFLPGLPEAMLLPYPDATPEAAALIGGRLSRSGALAVGPGLSRSGASLSLVRELCALAGPPLVLDADALHALAGAGPPAISWRRLPAVLTPHPGELASLVGSSVAAIQADRVAAARDCAARFNAVVVLKGARTVVAPPDGPAWVNPTGNPGLAAGGMGDVLTGVIAAHLARGMAPLVAALLGVYLHGLAGDLAAAATGPWGILASEVADLIPAAVRSLREGPGHAEDGKLTLLVP
jgi:NAD(P)H-hydrate epimerase